MFSKSEKHVKYVLSNTGMRLTNTWRQRDYLNEKRNEWKCFVFIISVMEISFRLFENKWNLA